MNEYLADTLLEANEKNIIPPNTTQDGPRYKPTSPLPESSYSNLVATTFVPKGYIGYSEILNADLPVPAINRDIN